MYRNILCPWMKNLWSFIRGYNERGNAAPLPFGVFITFTNPEMTCRIREQRDLAVRVTRRCVEALVVKNITADIESRTVPVSNDELKPGSLIVILGTRSDDMKLLLEHPGAIEFTKIVFLALDNFHYFAHETVPKDVRGLGAVQETFVILARALPSEWSVATMLDQIDTLMNVSDGQSAPALRTHYLNLCVRDLFYHHRRHV